ncbi:MAG: ABC transporter permease [Deltaproteobacteria bacterium]|nr:ABC transporter permease [Deltaproteobacteria bacterium]
MNQSIYHIQILNLLLAFIPLLIVVFIYIRWSLNSKAVLLNTGRMLAQLVLVGFVLTYIFKLTNAAMTFVVLAFMLSIASWIALHTVKGVRVKYYGIVLFALFIGCVPTLLLILFGVIQLNPWNKMTYLIPIAGMIFASAMNAVSLAAERFHKEVERATQLESAKKIAFTTSLIPITNSFLAVGVVSIPGMMTGQILAGVDPLIAVRYQIMVMAMLFGASGISSALFLTLITRKRNL